MKQPFFLEAGMFCEELLQLEKEKNRLDEIFGIIKSFILDGQMCKKDLETGNQLLTNLPQNKVWLG